MEVGFSMLTKIPNYSKLYNYLYPMKWAFFAICMIIVQTGLSQDVNRKGQVYALWGYNRSAYLPSDIRFVGPDYDFILYDVKAKDYPAEFDARTYFGPISFTIPQYNYRIGYFITEALSISIGMDHMKYVLRPGQQPLVDGYIGRAGSPYQGNYDDQRVSLSDDFVQLEHTDGFNYLSVELDNHWRIWKHANMKHNCDWFLGGGIGLMVPRSDVSVLDEPAANRYHIAGEGISVQTGFKSTFFRHLAVHGTLKLGLSRLHDILTTQSGDRASQNIGWVQGYWQIGYTGRLLKPKITHYPPVDRNNDKIKL